ncbi:hypothetical protein ACTFIR_002279 [Dictyostelium discoideum]
MSIPNLYLNLKELAYGYHTKECSDNYSKGRPSYPKECNDFLKGLGLSNESLIVDLAAGTGKFTEILAQEFNNIIAIEPSNTFRDECESLLKSILVNKIDPLLKYKVLNGLSTSIPLADNFHRLYNSLLGMALHKLKFGQVSKNPIEFEKIFRLHSDTKYHGGEDLIELIPPLPNPQITTGEKTIASSLSQSYISILPPNEKQEFINQLKQNLDNFELTSNNKEFTVYYETQIFHTRKPLN